MSDQKGDAPFNGDVCPKTAKIEVKDQFFSLRVLNVTWSTQKWLK